MYFYDKYAFLYIKNYYLKFTQLIFHSIFQAKRFCKCKQIFFDIDADIVQTKAFEKKSTVDVIDETITPK